MHKNLSGPKSRKAKNHFYCGSLCQRLVLSFRKRKYWFVNSFLSKLTVKDWKLLGQKKPFAPSCPQFLMKSPINMDDNLPHFQKISAYFFDLGEISRFDSFLTVKKLSKRDISLKSKKCTEIFWKYGRLLSIFIGDFIKNWGKVGENGFFWPRSFQSLTVSFDKKESANQKISFPKTQY